MSESMPAHSRAYIIIVPMEKKRVIEPEKE